MSPILRKTSAMLALVLLGLSNVSVVSAQDAGEMLVLMPHCTETDRSKCPEFPPMNGDTLKTNKMAAGDILDIDVVVRGPRFADVRTVRAWLSYDPAVLEVRSVELTNSALPSPLPGEQAADPGSKYVKIGGATSTGLASDNVQVARVTFRVTATTADTMISFHDFQNSGNGHTAVNAERTAGDSGAGTFPEPPCFDVLVGCRGSTTPLLSAEPGKLHVTLAEIQGGGNTAIAAETQSSVSSSTATGPGNPLLQMTSNGTSSQPTVGASSSFTLLQVQDVRVTSRDTMIFLGWQGLKSSQLAGYNVYYGTVSGRYIQRRSVPATATSLVLRDLEPGVTYYLALRAVNTQEQESAFSQEVSVTVGQPETATAPLTGSITDVTAPANPSTSHGDTAIRGETGIGNTLLYFVLASAVLGTVFAFKRQMTL